MTPTVAERAAPRPRHACRGTKGVDPVLPGVVHYPHGEEKAEEGNPCGGPSGHGWRLQSPAAVTPAGPGCAGRPVQKVGTDMNAKYRFATAALAGAVCALALAWPAAAGTIYVDDNAPGDPGPGDPTVSDPLEDGSASHPFDAIQQGIDAAVGGDTLRRAGAGTGEERIVARGTRVGCSAATVLTPHGRGPRS